MDTALRKPVTIRVFSDSLSNDPRFVDGFRRGLRASFPLLEDPGVAQVINYNTGEDGPQQFVVMEPVQGETVAQRLQRQGSLRPDEALRIATLVTDTLQAAHRLDLVHGGLTSQNVMVTRTGDVKLLDFGVARLHVPMQPADGQAIFQLSPERAAGGEASPASDVFSLAGLLYQLLTNKPPPGPGATLESMVPLVGNSLVQVCQQALDSSQETRPTLSTLSTALKRARQHVESRDLESEEAARLEAERLEAERVEAQRL
ncbi:MAG TPA: serine/threonine-protein kinase, partial [Actinomycetota bacterium]|nr:serine/threonine-protein kinase [Actinomycetota bacterium]